MKKRIQELLIALMLLQHGALFGAHIVSFSQADKSHYFILCRHIEDKNNSDFDTTLAQCSPQLINAINANETLLSKAVEWKNDYAFKKLLPLCSHKTINFEYNIPYFPYMAWDGSPLISNYSLLRIAISLTNHF